MIQLHMGDCLEVMQGMASGSVDLVVTDPPYDISGQKSKVDRAKYSRPLRDMIYGEWDKNFDLSPYLQEMGRLLTPTASVYVFCGGEQLSDVLKWLRSMGCSTRTLAWVKRNPTVANGQHMWLPAIECIAYGRRSGGTFNLTCKAGVWWETPPHSRYHPTQKPEQIIGDFIAASSMEGMTVLDPFMGSGTTGVACVNTNRHFIGIEKDAGYFAIAQERIERAQSTLRQATMEVGA